MPLGSYKPYPLFVGSGDKNRSPRFFSGSSASTPGTLPPETFSPLWYVDADRSRKWASDGTTLVTTTGVDAKYIENLGTQHNGQMATAGDVTQHHFRLKDIGGGHFSIFSNDAGDGANFGTYFANGDGTNGLTSQNVGEAWVLFKIYSAGNSTPVVLGSLAGTLPWWTDNKIYIRDFTATQFTPTSPISIGGATNDVWCLRISCTGTGSNGHKTYLNKLSDVTQTLINTGTATTDTNNNFSPQFGNVGYNQQNYNGLVWLIFNSALSSSDASSIYLWLQSNKPNTFSG